MNAALIALLLFSPAQERTKKIVLIAGPLDSHPRDTHEYEKNVILLRHCIETSAAFKGAKVETHFDGWPKDPAALDDADTIFMTSGGCDRKLEDHPLYVGDRIKVLEKQMARGCGLIQFHWSTFNPTAHHDKITEWTGGYFDYETGTAKNKWYSAIETKDYTTAIGTPDHPIARGVAPFKVREEFYFRIRFRDEDPRLKPILLRQAGGDVRADTVGWAVERKDGGRGFGFTGGHFSANWWIPEFRKLVLNAIAWTAKIEVPEKGVESELEKPARVLVLTGHHYPAHHWWATTPPLIHALEQDPRLSVQVTENLEDLATKKIDGADLLVLNYMDWQKPGLGDAAKEGLLRHIREGGGFMIFHGALGAFNSSLTANDWPEFRTQVVRRSWKSGSGHDDFGPFRVDVAPTKHPITDGLAPFDTQDELYVKLAEDGPLDPLVTARAKVTGKDEPLAWAHEYGKGRVFVTALGHGAVSIQKAAALFRRGAAWAARRAPLSFDPPATRTETATLRPGYPWKPPPPKQDEKKGQVLPADPKLDGGRGGHWGTQGEKDWVDGRVNAMVKGPFVTSALAPPGGNATKAVSVDLGGAAVCFDTEQVALRAGWKGQVEFGPARWGLIETPKMKGDLVFSAPRGNPWGDAPLKYRGLYVHGRRVIFSYTVDGVGVLDCPSLDSRALEVGPRERPLTLRLPGDGGTLSFAASRETTRTEDLGALTKGGPPRWGDPIVLKGHVSKEKGPYVVDTIPLPFDNPWKALLFPTGHDFFQNGDAAVCTVHGDVWVVRGIDETLEKVSWKRFATGLYQPLGLRIVGDRVHVLGRDQITILHDLNGDGEADFYEAFGHARPASMGGHDYVTCLETDADGNFYSVGPTTLHRLSRDGSKFETLASGFRNPNGLSVGPDGTITVAPQEGEWTPASMICEVRKGGHYGYGGPREGRVDPPLCYVPRLVDNSTGGQVWVPAGERWGPLGAQLLSLSFGRSSMQLVLRETLEGVSQGAVVPLPVTFQSGAARGRFRAQDGQLYVTGLKGWVSNAVRDGCFQRVRWTGAKATLPVGFRARADGIELRFSAPLDRESAADLDGWAAEQWNYRYSEKYGSEDYSPSRPETVGHDAIEIRAARPSPDGTSVFLEIPGLRPVHQLRLRWSLGGGVKGEATLTLHRLAPAR